MTFRFPARTNQQQGGMEGSRPAPAPTPARVSVFRRLLVRVTPAERLAADGGKDVVVKQDEKPEAAEVGSVALDRMVLSFMEDSAAVERPPRGRCNCFNGGGGHQDASDDEDFDFLPSSSAVAAAPAAAGDTLELLKGLVQCASTAERNLLADASRIAERCGGTRLGGAGRKKAEVRRAVAEGLRALGYDAAVCRSRWDRGPSHPAGEHEYIDAVVPVAEEEDGSGSGGARTTTTSTTRLVVEVDFRSEFEVARPTKAFRAALQALPPLFVGTPERAGRIVGVVAEAARQSLRKRGLHFPPWRKPEYMRAKWLAPHARDDNDPPSSLSSTPPTPAVPAGEFKLRFDDDKVVTRAQTTAREGENVDEAEQEEEKKITAAAVAPSPWGPEASEQQSPQPQAKGSSRVVTGLASVL